MLFKQHNTLMLLFDTLGRLGLVYQIVFLPSDKMISGLNQWFVSINGWSDKLIERAVYILAHKFFVQIGQVHFSRLALRLPWPARSDRVDRTPTSPITEQLIHTCIFYRHPHITPHCFIHLCCLPVWPCQYFPQKCLETGKTAKSLENIFPRDLVVTAF